MKHKIRQIVFACMLLLSFAALTACAAPKENSMDPEKESTLREAAEILVNDIFSMDEASINGMISQAEATGDTVISGGLQSWIECRELMGDAFIIDENKPTKVEETGDGYIVNVNIAGTLREAGVSVGFNKDLNKVTQLSFNPEYTVAEKMEKAAFNTLMGMGTVFAVLIFISFLISLFRFISIFENKAKDGKKAAAPVSVSEAAHEPEYEEAYEDDSELAAVISAAIAAYEGSGSDGLIVRSIKRVNNKRR